MTKTQTAPLFRKVDCLMIPVPSLEAGLQFYRSKLGHQLIWRTEDAAGLRLAGSETELVLHTKIKEPETDLLVDSADAAAKHFIAAGGKVLKGPFDVQIGSCVVLQDPFGNVLVALDMSKGLLVTNDRGSVIGNANTHQERTNTEGAVSVPEELRQLEERLLQLDVRRSAQDVANLLADEFVEFGSSGQIYDKQQVINGLQNEPAIQRSIMDFKTTALAPDVVLTTYGLRQDGACEGHITYSLRSSIWKLIEGRWRIIFHQGTRQTAIENKAQTDATLTLRSGISNVQKPIAKDKKIEDNTA